MSSAQTFSIVIPTYNRSVLLESCLRAISALDFPRTSFQVIVVNDGGAQFPAAAVDSFRSQLNVEFHTQHHGGPAAARNFGSRRAEGEWLAFTDDDCVPTPAWLKELEVAAKEFDECALGGSVVNGVPENAEAEASQLLFAHLYEYYHLSNRQRSQRPFFTSNNMAVPRRIFEEMGGFESSMRYAEDRDLSARLIQRGLNLNYIPAALVFHYRPMSLREFWHLHKSYGQGGFDFYRRQKARGVARLEPEGFDFYKDLVLYPWRQAPRRDAVRLSALLTLSQIANTFGFFQAMERASRLNSNRTKSSERTL